MNCTECDGGKLLTVRSTSRESNPVRRRKCTNCGIRTTTIEIAFPRLRELERIERQAILRAIADQAPAALGATA